MHERAADPNKQPSARPDHQASKDAQQRSAPTGESERVHEGKHPPDRATSPHQEEEQPNPPQAGRDVERRLNVHATLQIILSALLVFVTGLQAWTAWQQATTLQATLDATMLAADAAKRSADSLQLEQRAWLSIPAFGEIQQPSTDQEVTIRVGVLNTGKTPALHVIDQMEALVAVDVRDQPFLPQEHTQDRGSVIPPGGPHAVFLATLPPLTLDQLQGFQNKKMRLYVRGLVRYQDIWRQHHRTEFCAYRLYGERLGIFTYCEDGNRMD